MKFRNVETKHIVLVLPLVTLSIAKNKIWIMKEYDANRKLSKEGTFPTFRGFWERE